MIDYYVSLIKYIWITKSLTHRSCSSLTCISDWMRIGAFSFDSPDAFLMENLICPPKLPTEDTMQKMLDSDGSCILHNIKTGIWIAGNILQNSLQSLITIHCYLNQISFSYSPKWNVTFRFTACSVPCM
ncbi:hypothetical protein HanIR_Chr04g0196221 [Helianthus annuus]|nr:hypothetical protein HanIR_Chr04g0196221 [Helianthus annuus]